MSKTSKKKTKSKKKAKTKSIFDEEKFGKKCALKDAIILAFDLKYITETDFKQLEESCNEIGKMLYGLQNKLNS